MHPNSLYRWASEHEKYGESVKVWLGDITYVSTHESYLYLAAFLDLFTRKIVGRSISSTMTERLAMDAFLQGFGKEQPAAGLIVHTDQGS